VEQLDVYPNTTNKDRETLLFRDTRNGHEAVVMVLLELQDINPKTRKKSLTMRRSIVWNGEEGVMKVLLEQLDSDTNSEHKDGQIPLFISACHGHDRVVIVRQEPKEINTHHANHTCLRPLARPACEQQQGILKLCRTIR